MELKSHFTPFGGFSSPKKKKKKKKKKFFINVYKIYLPKNAQKYKPIINFQPQNIHSILYRQFLFEK